MKRMSCIAFITLLALAGCNKSAPTAAAGPAATVTLKDGSTFSGNVTKSDTSTITLQSATGESRTYPMTQVSSVQYGDASGASASVTPPAQPAPIQSAPLQSAPSSSVQPAPSSAPPPPPSAPR